MASHSSDNDSAVVGWLADLESKSASAPISTGYSGLPDYISMDGISPTEADVPIHLNTVVAASIGWLSRNLPVADLHVIQVTDSGDGPEIKEHEFIKLMDAPNPIWDFFGLWHAFVVSDVIDGNTLYCKVPNRRGGIHSFWWVAPWDFEIVANKRKSADNPISHFDVRVDGVYEKWMPNQVVHIKDGIDPFNPFRGMSPLKSGIRSASTIDRADFYTQTLMRNCGAISGMLSPSDPNVEIHDDNVNRLRAQFHEHQTGRNNGKPFISTQGLNFAKIALSPEEMLIDKLRDFPVATLCSLIGPSGMVMGLPDLGRTYSNLSEADRQAWNNGLIPRMSRAAEAFDRQCPEMIKPGQRLKWDYKNVKSLQDDWTQKIDSLSRAAGGRAILTVNEARAAIHLAPVDGGDVLPEPTAPVASVPNLAPIKPPPAPGKNPPVKSDEGFEYKVDGEFPEGDEVDPAEDNTFGLPDGAPLRSAIQRFAEQQLAVLLGEIPDIGQTLPQTVVSLSNFDAPMATAITPVISAYWDFAGKTTRAKLGLDPDQWQVVDPNTHRKIMESALSFCQETNASTSHELNEALDMLRQELVTGIIEQGESIPQLRKRVKSVFTELTDKRAGLIARTETSRALHAATLQSADESGVVEAKKWLASANSCPICLAIEESSKDGIPIDNSFATVGKHPIYSDVKTSPAHPQCRCTITLVLTKEYRDIIAGETGKPAPITIAPLDSRQKPIKRKA